MESFPIPLALVEGLVREYVSMADPTARILSGLALVEDLVSEYMMQYYVTDHCTLCGNRGVIDTRGVTTPAGLAVGRLNYCLCPTGLALRRAKAPMEWYLTH